VKTLEQTTRRDHCSVSAELLLEIQQFLYREARLLDNEQYDEWLELLTDDIHYWVPGVQARYRKDEAKFSSERMAYFHFHLIGNIEVLPTEDSNEWTVHSVILNHRHRTEDDEMELKARRVDTIRRNSEGLLQLARRKVILQETVLQAKNINTFL